MNGLGRSHLHFAVIFVCLLLTYVLGVSNLKSDPITAFSEWNSLRHVSLSPAEPPNSVADILASVKIHSREHGPLYFVFMRFWHDLVGQDLFTYRLLSVFFGLLTLAFAYRLALITRDQDTALAAALFTAFLAFRVYFTHEVRMYSLLPMFAAIVVWMYWKVVSRPGRVGWWQWISLALVSAAIIYVHYFGIMVLAAIGFYHLLLVPKDRRWFGICLAMLAAGVLFLPWLPVALEGLAAREIPTSDSLSLLESVLALSGIYTNGLFLIVPAVVVVTIVNLRQLGNSQKYILFLASAIFLLMILANEISPLIIARRIRYTIVLAIPGTCAVAIGLSLFPRWRLPRLLFAVVWIVSFFVYTGSDELSLYTNEKTSNTKEVPHYEDFIYQTDMVPRPNEPILSFHPFESISSKIQTFYAANLYQWKDIIHINYDDRGELKIKSWRTRNSMTLADLLAEYIAVWAIHNPQRTDLHSMEVYTDRFIEHYQPCKRYLDIEDNIIEYYVTVNLLCEILVDDHPFAISYDNGTEIDNVVYKVDADALRVNIWWGFTYYDVYSFTLQIFDHDGTRVDPQIDYAIGSTTLDARSLDISALPKGEYVVKLIVYDRLSLKSQQGTVLEGQQRFEREVEIARFSIGG